MKTLLFILLSFTIQAQTAWEKIKQRDDVLHFYGSVVIDESAYQIQTLVFPEMREAPKVLISNGVTVSCIFLKEWYDTKKRKPTGFNWADVGIGSWAIPVYDICNIVRYDWRHREEVLKIQDGYYEFNHHYLEKFQLNK